MKFKKRVSSILAVALLCAGGEAAFASTAQNQTGGTSINQNQTAVGSGFYNFVQTQKANRNLQQVQLGTNLGAGQSQAGNVTSAQAQSGTTKGPAVLSQGDSTNLNMNDTQTVKGSTQNQSTNASNTTGQPMAVQKPTHVVQADINHTAGSQFQANIAGGPKIQHQQVQQNAAQFQLGIETGAPADSLN